MNARENLFASIPDDDQSHLDLANTPWPTVHGARQNPGSLKGAVRVDEAADMVVSRMTWTPGDNLTEIIQQIYARANSVSVVKDQEGVWWTSGFGTVYALRKQPGGEAFEVLQEFDRQETTTFHGSYAFVDNRGFFYAAFQSTIERFHLGHSDEGGDCKSRLAGRPICREQSADLATDPAVNWISNTTGSGEDDKFVAYNLSPEGYMVLCTYHGNVFVSSEPNHVPYPDFGNITWRQLDLRDYLRSKSQIYRAFVQSSGDSSSHVSNSIGMGEKTSAHFALVPTAWGIVSVNVDKEHPAPVDFFPIDPYDASDTFNGEFLTRLGPLGTGSSPTSFVLNGRSYLTVTDGKLEPMSLHVVETQRGEFQTSPASIGVSFGDSQFSTSEQSASALVKDDEAHIVVVNNYAGINSFDLDDPNLWSVHDADGRGHLLQLCKLIINDGSKEKWESLDSIDDRLEVNKKTMPLFCGACSGGVNLYAFDGEVIHPKWSNVDVCTLTGIPLQTEDHVWAVGTERLKLDNGDDIVGDISLFALDRATGKVSIRAPLPGTIITPDQIENFVNRTKQSEVLGPIVQFLLEAANRDEYGLLGGWLKNTLNNIFYAGVETDGDSLVFGSAGGSVMRGVNRSQPSGYCQPDDACWPNAAKWNDLNATVGGRLFAIGEVEDVMCKCAESHVTLSANPFPTFDGTREATLANGACMQFQDCFYEYCEASSRPKTLPEYSLEAHSEFDVRMVLEFATEHSIPVSVKSSGHSYTAASSTSGSILIWMRNFKTYSPNEFGPLTDSCGTRHADTIKLGGGQPWGEVYKAVLNDGAYDVLGGSSVNVACCGGWLAGGGLTTMSRFRGLGIDNVLRYEVVLANGSLVVADECSNNDLFWALAAAAARLVW